jgi:osmotically-inducible protein OsmY
VVASFFAPEESILDATAIARRPPDPRIEASIHRVPEPAPIRTDEPFVGNETLEENLEEAVRVALWNATEGHCETIDASVFGGTVVLSGRTESADIACRCEEQVRAVAGVTLVNNLISWNGSDQVA